MKKFNFFFTIFLFVIFITSFVLEFILKFEPCVLCKFERWLYFILGIFFLFCEKYTNIFFYFCKIFVSCVAFLVAVYHKFVQIGLAKCHFGNYKNEMDNFENFRLAFENTVPCFVKSNFLGIELVWFNIVLFFFILCFEIYFFTKFYLTKEKK